MAAKKGTRPPNADKGRPKGAKNKVTRDVRAAITEIVEKNVQSVQTWLHAVAKRNPAKALELFIRLLEYHVPKLARSEMRLGLEEMQPKDAYDFTDEELMEIIAKVSRRQGMSRACPRNVVTATRPFWEKLRVFAQTQRRRRVVARGSLLAQTDFESRLTIPSQ